MPPLSCSPVSSVISCRAIYSRTCSASSNLNSSIKMAGRRVYGVSEMAAFESMIPSSASASAHAGFDGSGFILNFGEACGNTLRLVAEETGDGDDLDVCFHQPEKKRRLTADKVQFLEKSFETENKLEPERKVQLAKDLGLQPKQVAIWFQNRRARWKTKQLEKDYEALKSGYDVLKMDFEKLQKEKEKLQAAVIILTNKLLYKEKEDIIESALPKSLENNPVIGAKKSETPVMGVKQELLSSTNSAISDSGSPHRTNGGDNTLLEPAVSSTAFDPDHSSLSHDDEDEEVRGAYHDQFLKLQDNSNNFPFPVEDQALWFWPSY